jgi:hypothetical protein
MLLNLAGKSLSLSR